MYHTTSAFGDHRHLSSQSSTSSFTTLINSPPYLVTTKGHMSGQIHGRYLSLSSTNRDPATPDFWAPPETSPAMISLNWNHVRETLALRKRLPEVAKRLPASVYPPSLSTQAEHKLFYLDAYGITINHTIRRVEYGGVFADQKDLGYKKQSKKACRYVWVEKSGLLGAFIRDVVEIRDRYRSQKMFTTLVEKILLRATPLVYSQEEEGSSVWRPERCFEMGGRELEQLGWCFPSMLMSSPSTDDILEQGGEQDDDVNENEYGSTGIGDLSDDGEPPLTRTESGGTHRDDNEDETHSESESVVTKLTVHNLRALNDVNSDTSQQSEDVIPQVDGVTQFASHHSDDIGLGLQINTANTPSFQDIQVSKVNAGGIILSPVSNQRPRKNQIMGCLQKFLSRFYLRPLKKIVVQPSHTPLRVQDHDNPDGQVTTTTFTNLDPFGEDNPQTKYLSVPFETEQYHLLSKRAWYPAAPYHRLIQIAHHPVLHHPAITAPARQPTPWRAPSVSYWCRPVNFKFDHDCHHPNPQHEVTAPSQGENEESPPQQHEAPVVNQFLRSIPGLNNITSPYLSVQYADVTRAYDEWEFRRCTGTALLDLHIVMATGVYNRWLGHLHSHSHSGKHVVCLNEADDDDTEIGVGGTSLACDSEKGRDQKDQQEQELERSLRHYGLCIGLMGFSCWVAEPEVRAHPVHLVQPCEEGSSSTTAGAALTDTLSIGDTGIQRQPERQYRQQSREWAGCKITKVLEGRVDKFMDLDGLIEFINRAHEYGMGSFIRGVARDLGLGRVSLGAPGEGLEEEFDSGSESDSTIHGGVAGFNPPRDVQGLDEKSEDDVGGVLGDLLDEEENREGDSDGAEREDEQLGDEFESEEDSSILLGHDGADSWEGNTENLWLDGPVDGRGEGEGSEAEPETFTRQWEDSSSGWDVSTAWGEGESASGSGSETQRHSRQMW